jgi:hypothetical protein
MTADARLARRGGTTLRDPRSRVPIRTIAATMGRCSPSRSLGSSMSSAATSTTATGAASSPTQPPGPRRPRHRSLDHPNPASNNPATCPPPPPHR